MRFPILVVALMLPASVGSTTVGSAPAHDMPVFKPGASKQHAAECPPISRFHAAKARQSLRPRKLDELPMADAYAAVYRHIGRCEAPIIVRYGMGAPSDSGAAH